MTESDHQKSLIERFKLIMGIGGFIVLLVGILLYGLTGWSPWITYGVPGSLFLLCMLPMGRAILRQHREQQEGDTDSP
ncbi:hypothetical protein M1D88_00815 [Arthrobacter sp. R1-13]